MSMEIAVKKWKKEESLKEDLFSIDLGGFLIFASLDGLIRLQTEIKKALEAELTEN
jgi:hypothetical protein